MTTMTALTTTLTRVDHPGMVHMHLRVQDAEPRFAGFAEPLTQLQGLQGHGQSILTSLPAAYRILITELGQILLKYRNEDDTLSRRLFTQGERFKIFALEATEPPSGEVLLRHVAELRSLLRNPFGLHLLIKPCMLWASPDGVQPPCRFDLVWEESYLDAYCAAVSYVSTYRTFKKPHDFAMEMLRWIHSLPIPGSWSQGSHASQAPHVSQASHEYKTQGVMVNALGVTTLGTTTTGLSTTTLGVTTAVVARCQDPAPALPSTEKKARKMLAKFQVLIEQVAQERFLWESIGILQTMNQVLETQIATSDAEREARLDTFGHQLTHIAEETQAGLQAVKSEYTGAMQVVKEQLNRTESTLDQSRRELAQAKAEVSSLKVTVGALAYQNSQLVGRVGHLENEVNNSSSCSVM